MYNQCLTYIGEYLLALIYLLVSLLYMKQGLPRPTREVLWAAKAEGES